MNAPSPGPADVKVSVAMITYNHEQFIAEAIEGVLMQKTDFAVELVLGDDCSTDDTTSIIQDYAEKYPGKIKALLRSQNLGPAHSPGKNNLMCRTQGVLRAVHRPVRRRRLLDRSTQAA